MATRFRALAAPVDASTGDRRRFADGGLTHQPLPMPGRWVREDVGAHDNAVSVASGTGVEFDGDKVWVTGYWFDDVDRETMPRLAQDVAEAMYLARQGVIGISVDLDDFEAVPVEVGTDRPAEAAELEDPNAELELLITKGRIRSFTFVAIPAYVETNHTIEMLDADEEVEGEPADPPDDDPELASVAAEQYALVAAQLTDGLFGADAFVPPVPITGPTAITYDYECDPPRAYGHIYEHGTCHIGFKGECRTPPTDESFSRFHVHPVPTVDGPVFAGRLTAGGFHADEAGSLSDVQRAHDGKTTVAWIRASVDDFGILVCGPLLPDIDPEIQGILARRKVSGHWPVVSEAGELALAEILALPSGPASQSEPGFPIHPVKMHYRNGRFAGLTAALGPEAPTAEATQFSAAVQAAVIEAIAAVRMADAEQAVREERAAVAAAAREVLSGMLETANRADAARIREQLVEQIGV